MLDFTAEFRKTVEFFERMDVGAGFSRNGRKHRAYRNNCAKPYSAYPSNGILKLVNRTCERLLDTPKNLLIGRSAEELRLASC